MIFVCTLDRYAELRDGGRAMCDECGKFIVGGERVCGGIVNAHGEHHDNAMDAVERERNALVALSASASRSDSVDSAYVHNKTKKETREEDLKAGMEAARRGDEGVMEALIAANRVKPLPLPGLEAARRGDLNSLRTLVIDGWDPSSTTAVDRHEATRSCGRRARALGVRQISRRKRRYGPRKGGAERTTVVRRSVRVTLGGEERPR